jgi:hypothetical protein
VLGRSPEWGLINALNVYCMQVDIQDLFRDGFDGLNNGTAKFQKNVIHAMFDDLGIIIRIVLSYELVRVPKFLCGKIMSLHDIIFQPLPATRLR